nr:D-glycero-beta-D-manno-heptose-7-phosphate kinase [Gammaproteobacteria bacterium]
MRIEIPDFAAARVLVCGDVMLDRYWSGDTARISPEAPVPVVRVGAREQRPGGAANVALNMAALGAGAALVGVIGRDDGGRALGELLDAAGGIDAALVEDPDAATVTKLRVLSRHQQLIRLDFEQPEPGLDGGRVLPAFERALAVARAVVLSDYAKGTLSRAGDLIAAARGAGTPVLVDPKGRDFERYEGADAVTPNLAEFEAVAGRCRDEAELVERARAVAAEHAIGALLVTRGEHGMTLVPAAGEAVHIPAQAREVFDVTGAGDTVIATLGAAVAAGAGLEQAARLANLAA